MKLEKGKSELPLGLGSELESSKETLPAVEVKNQVFWINPNLDFPFKLEEGEPTPLGLFLSSKVQHKEKSQKMGVKNWHGRSAQLPRIIFGEKSQTNGASAIYRDIDIKGVGFTTNKIEGESRVNPDQIRVGKIEIAHGSTTTPDGAESFGILNLASANRDAKVAEKLHEYGIRTNRVVAIILLDEIILLGQKISIAEAKEQKLIPENVIPVLEIRAFGTHARLYDVYHSFNESEKEKKQKELLIEDARVLVAQELGILPEKFDRVQYASWLAKTVGHNLSLMHKHGWVHNYLNKGHNITLDGCFVDFDSAQQVEQRDDRRFYEDLAGVSTALELFLTSGLNLKYEIIQEIKREFGKSCDFK